MEGCKLAMVFTIYMIVLVSFASFGATVAAEDAAAPSPMQSTAAALGVPAALGAMASLLAWFF
ncbi:hypothetical protein Pyn_15767 [Prunus yedoensis var. nudiflora]|uniref:Uncharacterized protein n=1 Tax=Prunus yedoensis var. nudiflora TaxID=2094558 RepID=A0A314YNJ6_PRUYE|nr:hypothetical protein Pyn_15767 [Prunus yedoensis var. nudiflora]